MTQKKTTTKSKAAPKKTTASGSKPQGGGNQAPKKKRYWKGRFYIPGYGHVSGEVKAEQVEAWKKWSKGVSDPEAQMADHDVIAKLRAKAKENMKKKLM